jgi:hypothetical protein
MGRRGVSRGPAGRLGRGRQRGAAVKVGQSHTKAPVGKLQHRVEPFQDGGPPTRRPRPNLHADLLLLEQKEMEVRGMLEIAAGLGCDIRVRVVVGEN